MTMMRFCDLVVRDLGPVSAHLGPIDGDGNHATAAVHDGVPPQSVLQAAVDAGQEGLRNGRLGGDAVIYRAGGRDAAGCDGHRDAGIGLRVCHLRTR